MAYSRIARIGSKRLINSIYKSAEYCSCSPIRSTQTHQTFSTTSRQNTKRNISSNIALPSYVTSTQLNTPSIAEVKTDEQISQMSPACRLAASILQYVGKNIKVSYSLSYPLMIYFLGFVTFNRVVLARYFEELNM